MKSLIWTIGFLMIGTIGLAQVLPVAPSPAIPIPSPYKPIIKPWGGESMEKQAIKRDLVRKSLAIPVNGDFATVFKALTDDKGNSKLFVTPFYAYRILLGTQHDIVEVFSIRANPFQDSLADQPDHITSQEPMYTYYIGYECTDPKHNPKHSGITLQAMKKLQKQYGCSGIKMLIAGQ